MCGTGPTWKREVVPDHKFDFVDTREFTDNGCGMRSKYLWLYLLVLKSFLVYILDIFSATTMLSTDRWSNEIFRDCNDKQTNNGTQSSNDDQKDKPKCIAVDFTVGKWLFVGCIIFSFLLLAYEARKTKKIIASRDISYAFTNVMANHYYSLRSYDHFCFFDHISNSTKLSDDFAFFVFFTFKDWKRLLLADAPRQTINALILYSVFLAVNADPKKDPRPWYNPVKYVDNELGLSTNILSVTTFFTVAVCAGSILLMLGAAICYIPLLFHIRGNLKEYCCHQVDKRISTVIKRRQKQRLADAAELAKKEARGDYSHLKNKNGELVGKPLPQPTLPNISLDDDLDSSSINTKQPPPSTYTQDYNNNYYYNSAEKMDYPPMPGYNQYAGDNPQYASSHGHYGADDKYYYQGGYEDDNASTANLALGAAPFAHQSAASGIDRMGSPMVPHQGAYDSRDVYQGRGGTPANDPYRGTTPANDPYRNGTPANDPYRGTDPANDPYRGATPANDPYRGATPANDPYRGAGQAVDAYRGTTPANDPYRGTTPTPQYHPTGYNDGYSNYGGAPNHGGQYQSNNGQYGNQGGGGGGGYAM
ncbi:hypothetical protein BDV98DRAFT_601117 [Pterulicium gracile]|uniref:Vacuole protein n=1 Tax=Pterulicium gracile TaxID=1884261 RepID=A0A5C3QYC7_9AGAR|nr:hypothetical protein BDV98DRAFT_601117 [Pterula gracilis]